MVLKCRKLDIILSEKPNRHLLIWGNSGTGKTYFCCRKLEEEYLNNRKTLILDYSGSYTNSELKKGCLDIPILVWNPYENPFYWNMNVRNSQDFSNHLTDMLITVLGITGYWQKRILLETVSLHLNKHGNFNFTDFYRTLEILFTEKQMKEVLKDEITNTERLLARFYPYRQIDKLYICSQKKDIKNAKYNVFLLQLSDFPILQRNFLTALFSEMLWLETERKTGQHCYDTLLFDEFQHLSFTPDNALSKFLREGRKYGVGVLLCSQFISTCSQEEQNTLFQASNTLIFRPNECDLKFSAQILNRQQPKIWLPILQDLPIGAVILKGHYHLKNKINTLTSPIVCTVPFKRRRR